MKKYLIIGAVVAALVWMVSDAVMQPGVDDLRGDFKEVTFTRNEQNTGPVVRVYAVTLKDTLWAEMEKYGNYMPHTKYGITRVYFFLEDKPAPNRLFLEGDNLDDRFKQYCVARFEKNAMSQTYLSRYPFKGDR